MPDYKASSKGIKEINLERLGSLVALVGKNGCGKTRIFQLIEQNLTTIFSINRFLDNSIVHPPKILMNGLKKLEPYKDYLLLKEKMDILKLRRNLTHNTFIDAELQEVTQQFEEAQKKLRIKLQPLKPPPLVKPTFAQGRAQQNPPVKTVIVNVDEKANEIVNELQPLLFKIQKNYVKKISNEQLRNLQATIEDAAKDEAPFEELIQTIAENLDYNEITSINRSALTYLKKLPGKLVSDYFTCKSDMKKLEQKPSFKNFIALKNCINIFLNKELDWEPELLNQSVTQEGEINSTHKGIWKLDNRVFNYEEFSEGEKTLFSYALLFFLLNQNPNLTLKESILFIDEPELHLHPDSEIELVDNIRKALGDHGQLWIASHSINILSDLNFDEIFMVKRGEISHPSHSIQRQTLSELMSLDTRVAKLSEFLTSISDWTIINFMTQCFTDPDVIECNRVSDPQVELFKNAVKTFSKDKNNMLLDFGAGKGRLFELLSSDKDFTTKFSYAALEPQGIYHDKLREIGITKIYSESKDLPKETFDIIVLCNVLHEIKPSKWQKVFLEISESLNNNGFLLILEQEVLNKGEKIEDSGYLITNPNAVKCLFELTEEPITLKQQSSSNALSCIVIQKESLKPIEDENIILAIESIQEYALKEIMKLRNNSRQGIDEKQKVIFGRKSAFYNQLFVNSTISLKKLEGDKSNVQSIKSL